MDSSFTSQAAIAWAERFDRFRTADMTVAQFCNAECVSQASYYHWQKKLHGNPKAARKKSPNVRRRFVPVALGDSSHGSSQGGPATVMAVELPGGIRIRFEVNCDPREDRT